MQIALNNYKFCIIWFTTFWEKNKIKNQLFFMYYNIYKQNNICKALYTGLKINK